jgi:hypothetical protein
MPAAVNEPGRGSRPSQVATVESPAFQAGVFNLRAALKGGGSNRSRFYDEKARGIALARARLKWGKNITLPKSRIPKGPHPRILFHPAPERQRKRESGRGR